MRFSEAYKFVYIAVPRTGTTAVEKEIQRIDPGVLRNHVILPSGEVRRVNKHINVANVQALLGEKSSEYKYFGFIREPVDQVISRYFYYSKGRSYQRYKDGLIGSWTLRYKLPFSRLMPRPLWFVFYPFRKQTAFLRDQHGHIPLDFCGRADRLDNDLEKMPRRAGYTEFEHQLTRLNVAPRDEIGALEKRFIKTVVKLRLQDDIAFYRNLEECHDVS